MKVILSNQLNNILRVKTVYEYLRRKYNTESIEIYSKNVLFNRNEKCKLNDVKNMICIEYTFYVCNDILETNYISINAITDYNRTDELFISIVEEYESDKFRVVEIPDGSDYIVRTDDDGIEYVYFKQDL
jgi:hypothetical protein